MLEYDVTITEEDYLKFNMNVALNTKNGKQALAITRLLFPFSLLIVFALFIPEDFYRMITFMVVCIIASIIWVLLSKKIHCNGVKAQIKKLKKQGKLPYSEKSKITFNENEFCEYTSTSHMKRTYADIENIYVTDDGIYICVDLIYAFLLPNSCFSQQHPKQELINFLKNKIDLSLFK